MQNKFNKKTSKEVIEQKMFGYVLRPEKEETILRIRINEWASIIATINAEQL